MTTPTVDISSSSIEKVNHSKSTCSKVAPFKKISPISDKEEQPEHDTPFSLMEGGSPPSPLPIVSIGDTIAPPLVSNISADVFSLFESMAGTMMVMNLSHETRTTIVLNQPSFVASPFFGTEITISEFTTAPKTFNIEIVANPSAILAIQKGEEQLLSLFTRGNFGFSIHRLETKIQCDPVPVFGDPQEQEEENPRDKDEEP